MYFWLAVFLRCGIIAITRNEKLEANDMKRLLKGIGRFILAVIAAVIVLCAVGMCLSIFGDNHIVWYLPLKI